MSSGPQPFGTLPIIAIGMAGSLVGGLAAWYFWPPADGQLHVGGLVASFVGSLIGLWAYLSYVRRAYA
jgi:uncharacterized membrane protein YeaQ/YmgE (transglycosylase-associated protein family)